MIHGILFSGLVGDLGLGRWLNKNETKATQSSKDHAVESTGGGDEPVRWVPIATAMGAIEASMIAGRLESEGIPARISQEAAGAALGLTIGLGRIRVLVPEEMATQAQLVLDEPGFIEIDEEFDEWEDNQSQDE